MLFDVTMPMLDEVMEEGTIVSWNKSKGDSVKKGELLFVVETDKATMDVEATKSGVVAEILAEEGDTVPCNQTIARIEVPQ
jgi:pyruvate/2-oxoglutarate dehydrogenase complex dihydrolipoamide acyltransferase (E2) component